MVWVPTGYETQYRRRHTCPKVPFGTAAQKVRKNYLQKLTKLLKTNTNVRKKESPVFRENIQKQ
jgi:hypothetical protein